MKPNLMAVAEKRSIPFSAIALNMLFYLEKQKLIKTMRYVFNHYYILRHDLRRSVLCSRCVNKSVIEVSTGWFSYIHPIYAMLLSFFSSPVTLEQATKNISEFFDFTEEYTSNLIQKFVENKDVFHTDYHGTNNFPKNVIIKESDLRDKTHEYTPEMYTYSKVDLDTFRLFSAPLYMTFMVSNKCLTNCVYCYADRNTRCKDLDFFEVERIVNNAYKLNLQNINIDGGEFFMYPHWRKLLTKLKECEYKPDIVSTKYPITEQDVMDFSKFEINLQVSFDSLNQQTLNRIVGPIKNYANRMQDSLRIINRHMPFQVATILTKYNADIDGLERMYAFLNSLDKLKRWEIRVAFMSLYTKKDFNDIRLQRDDIEKIKQWVEAKQHTSRFEITWNPGQMEDFFKAENGSEEFAGGRCSANTMHMFVLPDGQVTICEQLYWKKNFIIGDLKKETIEEVWNSKRALYLANMKKEDYSESSACRNCSIFDKCKKNMNSCYTNIIKAYGEEHWDYHDPRCAKAPRNIPEYIYI